MTDDSDTPGFSYGRHLQRELMQVAQRLPAMLDADLEGDQSPVSIPPEQVAEYLRATLTVVVNNLPNLANEVDRILRHLELKPLAEVSPTD